MAETGGGRVTSLPLALAVSVGGATGSLVAWTSGGLGSRLVSPAPVAADLGLRWSPEATPPETLYRAAVDGLGLTTGALGLATGLVALAAAATLLVAAGSLRRRELAVRGALGAPPFGIALLLVRRESRILAGGLLGGILAGAGAAFLLHGLWPVERPDGSSVSLVSAGVSLAVAATTCGVLALGLALLPTRYGVRALARSLGAGSRATADPREGGLRRVATVAQTGLATALLASSILLWRSLPDRARPDAGSRDGVVLLSAASEDGPPPHDGRAARYRDLLERLRGLPTLASESIASPGAWTGVATSDFVLSDCGNCRRGMFWIPFLGEDARHYAVSPGFFESAGMELLAGRDFTLVDGPGSEPVAIVTESMARDNFEDGDPLGRRVRVGAGLEGWHTVVGVVRERRSPGLGLPDEPAPGVYLSAFQHPPDRIELAFRITAEPRSASPDVPDDVRAAASEAGLALAPGPRTSSVLLRERVGPLRWAAGAAGALGLVALLSALLGVHRVAAVEVAARRRELGIRLALGSTPSGVTRWVLGRAFRGALLGVLLAVPPTVAIAARLRETVGDVRLFDPTAFAGLAALLVPAAVLGAWGPARAAAGLEPALVMSEE